MIRVSHSPITITTTRNHSPVPTRVQQFYPSPLYCFSRSKSPPKPQPLRPQAIRPSPKTNSKSHSKMRLNPRQST